MITIAVGPFQWLVRLAAQMGIIVQKKHSTQKNRKEKPHNYIAAVHLDQRYLPTVSDPGPSEPTTLWYLVGMKTFGKGWRIIDDNSSNIHSGVLCRPNDVKLAR